MNQLNNIKTENNETQPLEPVALVDCGQASQVTKGVPYLLFFELASPPYDRALVW